MIDSPSMLIPVILCGGVGSRLWPVSREQHPKPFMLLSDGQSLVQKAFVRGATLPDVAELLTVSNRDLLFKARDHYRAVNDQQLPTSFILEPFGRNTAAAVAAAALYVQQAHGPDALMLVLAADRTLDADQGQHDAQGLIGPQPLAEEHHAQEHVDQRVDEVAQAGLEHLAADNRVDEHQPVGGNKQCAQPQHEQQLAAPQFPPQFVPPPQEGNQNGQHGERPQCTMGQDFHWGHVGHRLEVQGKEAPGSIGGGRGKRMKESQRYAEQGKLEVKK